MQLVGGGAPDLQAQYDVNYRAALWPRSDAAHTLRPLAQRADTVFASEDELELVTPEGASAAAESLAVGGRAVVVKRGASGASVFGPDGIHERRAVDVAALDTVGAGDAFVAGYLSGRLDGLDADGRLDRGCAAGAFAVSSHGDWEGLPTREELALLAHGPGKTLR